MTTTTRSISHLTFVQIVIALAGAVNLFTGAALLLAPGWFFNTIGNFPPFNRHYLGDVGSFLLPIGIGLLIAVSDPARHRSLIGVAAAGSLLHALNHLYDDFIAGQAAAHFLIETVPLIVLAVLLAVAYFVLRRS
jgi:hypothetical protein